MPLDLFTATVLAVIAAAFVASPALRQKTLALFKRNTTASPEPAPVIEPTLTLDPGALAQSYPSRDALCIDIGRTGTAIAVTVDGKFVYGDVMRYTTNTTTGELTATPATPPTK